MTTEETTPPTLSAPPGSGAPTGRLTRWDRYRTGMVSTAFVGLALLVLLVVYLVRPTDYYAIKPGSVRDTTEIIRVDGVETFLPQGVIGFTTVTVSANITNWEKRQLSGRPDVLIVHEDDINGGRTSDERRERDRLRMENSKGTATIVALDYLGYEATPTGNGAEVTDVVTDVPAAEVLQVGDVITAVDGEPIEFADDLVAAVRARQPADLVTLTLTRPPLNELLEPTTELVEVELASVPDDPERALLGVSITTAGLDASYPFDVEIDSGNVGGPSAGLAFTLGLIDVLTPGELTGGHRVATTGTIELDGTIGPVGGAHQKAVAASESGVELFIVPSSELDAARAGNRSDMRIEPADSLEEAMALLDTLGGNALALGVPGEGDLGS